MFYIHKMLGIGAISLSLLPFNLTLFTYIMIFFGINQNAIYPEPEKVLKIESEEKETAFANKTDRGLLDEKQTELLSATIFQYLKSKKPYLNPEYSLQMMADDLNISREKLSYFINNAHQKNFYKFVNEFRIAEVKEKLVDKALGHYTVLGIGLDCGFNSKTSFNRIFKEETGLTPSEFRKQYSELKVTE